MAGQLERLLQSMLQTAPSLVTQVTALLQAPSDTLGSVTDTITTAANGATQLIWDSGTQGFWDQFCWDTPPAALTVGGLVWDHAGAQGAWDQGAVWNP